MGTGILVFCEHEGGALKKTAFELLSKARALAGSLGGSVSAVVVGDADGAEAGHYGASTVYRVRGADFTSYTTDAFTAALAAVIAQASPAAVLAAASPVGKDLFPRLGARLGAGVVTEVTDLAVEGGALVGRRPIYAGKAVARATVKSTLGLFTVRPNSFPITQSGGAAAVVDVAVGAVNIQARVVEVKKSDSKVVDLTEADRIVSGGRSVKSAEGFDQVIRPLAAVLGATPGASRAAVDAGYAPHSHQVGQTGKVVNPTLYIAAGISGAIQHLAGMRTSKVIVAINKDPEAPIFQHSTYGIVDDLFVVCPALQKEFSALLG